MADPYLSIRQAAREVSARGTPCSYWQVLHRIDTGRVPSVEVGGRRFIHRDHLPQLAEAVDLHPEPRQPAPASPAPF